jgi:hypothetical protein
MFSPHPKVMLLATHPIYSFSSLVGFQGVNLASVLIIIVENVDNFVVIKPLTITTHHRSLYGREAFEETYFITLASTLLEDVTGNRKIRHFPLLSFDFSSALPYGSVLFKCESRHLPGIFLSLEDSCFLLFVKSDRVPFVKHGCSILPFSSMLDKAVRPDICIFPFLCESNVTYAPRKLQRVRGKADGGAT